MSEISVARIYDDADGYRVLLDRIWPRGVSKEDADLDLWAKDVAPSDDLRTWFHNGGDYDEFAKRYRAELKDSDAYEDFSATLAEQKNVVLLTASKYPERSHLSVMKQMLSKRDKKN